MKKILFKQKIQRYILSYKPLYFLYFQFTKLFRKKQVNINSLGHWYRKTKKNAPIYYVLRFTGNMGIGAVADVLMLAWPWVKKQGMIPVVMSDLGIGKNVVADKDIKVEENLWEEVFDVDIKLEEVLKKENVYLSHENCAYQNWKIPNDLKKYESPDQAGHLKVITNVDDMYLYYKYGHQFFKPSKKIIDWANQYIKIFEKHKVLGVGMREEFSIIRELGGTCGFQYLEKVLYRHPIIPTVDECIIIIEKYLKETECNRIFLATMFEDTINLFEEHFGKEQIIYIDRNRTLFSNFLKDPDEYVSTSKNMLIEDFAFQAETYMKESLMLSKCAALIMPLGGQIRLVGMLKEDKFENVKFFENYNKLNYTY